MKPEELEELKGIKEQAAKNLEEIKSANATIVAQGEIIKNLTDKVATLESTLEQYDTPEDVGSVLGEIKDLLKQADDVIADPAPVPAVETDPAPVENNS